jgi:membrane-associated phospholipid phosphatase
MNRFDLWVIHLVNSLARRSWIADAILVEITSNRFLVGGVLMVMFWWAWMKHGSNDPENRVTLALNLVITAFAVGVARGLALSLPYRSRPFQNPLLHFQVPYTSTHTSLINWSSFPSDHAVVLFCVATGLAIVSARLGALALGYATLITVPRIYIGAHYPTDILAGALLGVGLAFLCKISNLRKLAARVLNALDRRPAILYPLLFAATYEIGGMFDSLRHIGLLGLRIAGEYPPLRLAEAAALMFVAALLCVLAWLQWRKRRSAT